MSAIASARQTGEPPKGDSSPPSSSHQRWRARARGALGWLGCALLTGLITLPLTLQDSVERAELQDAIGTFPAQLRLCHDGRSTLETGVLGDVYFDRTGAYGLGIHARIQGPPEAGMTLASYVDPAFVQANLQFIDDPDAAVTAYSSAFNRQIEHRVFWVTVASGAGLGTGLFLVLRLQRGQRKRQALMLTAVTLVGGLSAAGVATWRYQSWDCGASAVGYSLEGVPDLRFSSPQTRELAQQIQVFIERNVGRNEKQSSEYLTRTRESLSASLEATDLSARPGETVVIAEADPQGSRTATQVRAQLYPLIRAAVGAQTEVVRTISGDLTSNGTVAEAGFVRGEARLPIPTALVLGDHDNKTTAAQVDGTSMRRAEEGEIQLGELEIWGRDDVERKELFGALVRNDTGVTEQELGAQLRRSLPPSDRGRVVLLHQPDAVAGYLDLGSGRDLRDLPSSLTEPVEDGVPDVPPGTVNIGHLHRFDGPWVLWNTDADPVTWTVIDQLGTSGGVENEPTFNRFSTPTSLPLKPLGLRLQYVDQATGLQTGYATVLCDVGGTCLATNRVDIGLPLTQR